MNAIERLRSALCGADGNVVINGSDADRALVEQSLDEIEAALQQQGEAVAYARVHDKNKPSFCDVVPPNSQEAEMWAYDLIPLYTHPPKPVVSDAWRDAVMDGIAVLKELTPEAKRRTSHENVSDVLDAVARVARAAALGVKS